MKIQNLLEWLYEPFINTLIFIKNLCLLLYYIVTNEKMNKASEKEKEKILFYYGQKTINESKISSILYKLEDNFHWIVKLFFVIFIFWFVYKIIINLGLIEIVKYLI